MHELRKGEASTMHRIIVVGLTLFCLLPRTMAKSKTTFTRELLDGYDKKVRPGRNFTESVRVSFRLHLIQLQDVSEVSQKIQTKLWLYHRWTDRRLRWNKDDYKGLEYINLPAEKLWIPIFVLYNNADGDFAISNFSKAKVYHNGTIVWKPPAIFSSFCEIQVAKFPFDTQNCTMKIGPWTRGKDLLDMVNYNKSVKDPKCDAADIVDYDSNGEWKMLSVGCYKHYINYTCCAEPYVDMTYYFVIQRRPLFILVNVLFPTMLFSVLTCSVFYLPSDAGEKMTLSVSILLSLVVFLLVIVEAIPSTAKGVPLLGKYILFTMILVTLSIIITVFVLNIHYRAPSTHTLPTWTKKLFIDTLPRLMFTSTLRKRHPFEKTDGTDTKKRDRGDMSGTSKPEGVKERAIFFNPDSSDALDGVQLVSEHFKDEEDCFKEKMDWKYIAMVLDHFLLYVFVAACLLGTLGIFGKRLIELGYEEELFKSNNNECLLNCPVT